MKDNGRHFTVIAGCSHRDAVLLLDGAADLSLDLLGGLLAAGLGHGQAHRGILGGAARLVHGQALQPITGQY